MTNYNSKKAGDFWSKRLKDAGDPIRAVLAFSEPDYVNDSYNHWESNSILRAIYQYFPKAKDTRILDIGCGWGRLSIPLLKKGYNVVGLDVSDGMLDEFKKNIRKLNNKKSGIAGVYKGECSDLSEIEDNSFDVIIMAGVLEHIPIDIRMKAIEEIYRVMKPNGMFFLIINNAESIYLAKIPRYKTKKQRRNGYFISLMNKKQMMLYLNNLFGHVVTIGSNYQYSLGRHVYEEMIPKKKRAEFFMANAKIDLQHPFTNTYSQIPDQFVVMAVKKEVKK